MNAEPHGPPRYPGKYRGTVRDIHDPWMANRIRAEVPFPLGTGEANWSTWALPCLPPGHNDVPEEGVFCWIEFENGDPNLPVWVGIWYAGRGDDTTVPWQATHAPLTNFFDVVVDRDKRDHTRADSTDNSEHTEWHDHSTLFYEPHERGILTPTGHFLHWNDHPGKDAFVWLSDRYGRKLNFFARGISRLRSYLEPQASAEWKDIFGAAIDGYHEMVLADWKNDATFGAAGQYLLIRSMAQAFLKFTDTPGGEKIELQDIQNQVIRINTKLGSEFVEILDKAGQHLKMDPVAGTVRVDDVHGNYILMANGKITLYVPDGAHVFAGDEAGQQLVTRTFLNTYYNSHFHSSSAGPTGPPLTLAPMTDDVDVTKKLKAS